MTGESRPRPIWLSLWPVGIFLVVTAAHLRAVSAEALLIYGHRGAEYLEHIQREHALHLADGLGFFNHLGALPDHLALLDGEYPAGLHLMASLWAHLAGGSIPASLHLGLVFVLAAAVGAGGLAWELSQRHPSGPSPLAAVAAASLTLLTPAVYATARRYYYDLPLTGLCALAAWALIALPRRPWAIVPAALFSGLAALTKWQAGLYLAPVLVWAFLMALRSGGWAMRGRGALSLVLTVLAAAAVTLPLLRRPLAWLTDGAAQGDGQSSLLTALSQRHSVTELALSWGDVTRRLSFYGEGAVFSTLGVALAVALVAAAALGMRRRLPLVFAMCCAALPVSIFISQVRVMDERFLLPIAPLVIAGVAAAAPWSHGRLAAALFIALAQLVALEFTALPLAHGSVAGRGWSRQGALHPSPWRIYDQATRMACGGKGAQLPGEARIREIHIEASLLDPVVHGWRWGLARHCPGWSLGGWIPGSTPIPGDGIIAALPPADEVNWLELKDIPGDALWVLPASSPP